MDAATIIAFNDELSKIALANGLDKDAGIFSGARKLLGLTDEAAEAAQKAKKWTPSYAGDTATKKEISKRLGAGTTVNPRTKAVKQTAVDVGQATRGAGPMARSTEAIPIDWLPPSALQAAT
jgi:hypothetical protein